MADVTTREQSQGAVVARYRDEGDGTHAKAIATNARVWDTSNLVWVRQAGDASGTTTVSSTGGGGGAATIADGADVAQGTTTDLSSANTVVGILKAIKAAITGTVAVSGPVTDTQLRASAVPVSMATQTPDVTDRSGRLLGHVTVDNASLAVTLASAPTTAVTGPLTDTQLRASAVPVSLASAPTTAVTGTFWQTTQPVSGTVAISNTGFAETITGTDGVSTGIAATVKSYNGANVLFVRDPEALSLMSEVLGELQRLNRNLKET